MIKGKRDVRRSLAKAIIAAKTGSAKLERMAARIDARRGELERMVEDSILRGDEELAKRYAEEAAQLKSLLRRVVYLQTVLERLRLRLETAYETGIITESIRSIAGIIGELRVQDLAAIPEIGLSLDEIDESIRALGADLSIPEPHMSPETPLGEEASKILEEARVIAEEKLKAGEGKHHYTA